MGLIGLVGVFTQDFGRLTLEILPKKGFFWQDTPKGKLTWNLRYTTVEKEKHLQTPTFGLPC